MSYKLKIRTQLPATLAGGTGMDVAKDGLVYTVAMDYSALEALETFTPTEKFAAIYDSATGIYNLSPITAFANAGGTGTMMTANNLSDVAATYSAKDNISVHGADVASATTIDLEAATGDLVDVTGTTAITTITLSEGHERTVRFTGILILTNGASLILPGAANITTAAGDFAVFRGYAAGVVRCVNFQRAAGDVAKQMIHGADIASATTTVLETATGDLVDVTGTTTITAITLTEGHERVVRFTGALTLTNGASLLLPGAANITTAAGDFAVFRGYAAGVVRCVSYQKLAGGPVMLGYQVGDGGAQTQATSRTTTTVLSKLSGAITLFAAAPVVGTWVSCTITNTLVAITDTISVSVKSGTNTYICHVTAVAAGSFQISFTSIAGTASDSPVINFNVIKGVAT